MNSLSTEADSKNCADVSSPTLNPVKNFSDLVKQICYLLRKKKIAQIRLSEVQLVETDLSEVKRIAAVSIFSCSTLLNVIRATNSCENKEGGVR